MVQRSTAAYEADQLKIVLNSATCSVHELGQIIPEIGFPEQQSEVKVFTIPKCEEG